MAEAVGLAASVAQFASISYKLIAYAAEVQHHQEEAKKFTTETNIIIGLWAISTEIKDDTSVIRSKIEGVEHRTSTVADQAMRQQHDRIVSFISPDDFGSKIDDVLMRRASETGHWFLSHDTFKDWVHGEGKTLWCPGIPGAGKTTLMSIAIEHLHDRFAERDDAVVLYIFCDYRKRNDQNPRNLLASLWGQLLRKRVLNEAECQSLKERYVDKNIRLLVEDIRQLTYEEARRYSRYFILVDALYELEEEHRVPLLDALYTLHPGINLLITSRIMRFNELGLRHAKELEIMAEDSDLRKYIVEREGRLEANVRKDKKLIRDIEDVIIERAQGMFLLAKLHLESIVTKRTPRQVRKALESLPQGKDAIRETYDQA
ncbi:hypothetical protein K4K60_006914 [Colletotrichum sp. SAR11_57]|nr:hypothetical protein K4K60_006914 [Colletotrichum sp. SAR11_57]